MPKYVNSGAKIKCSFGSSQGLLTVLPNSTSLAGGAMATIMDNKSMMNIKPCGMCRSLVNPQVAAATSAAMGVLTPMPCIPNTPGPWLMGKSDFKVKNKPVLMDNARLMCSYGGIITIASVGKTAEDKADKVEEKKPKCAICGKEIQWNDDGSIKEASKYCRENNDLTQCPNKSVKCRNKNDDNTRKGCDGYQRGSVGFGMMLGNNILVHRYKITREGYDDITYHAVKMGKKMKNKYKEAALESFQLTLEGIEDEGLKEKLIERETKLINNENKKIRVQKRDCHPLFVDSGSIQAHHLICSEAMDNEKWINLCKATGYNINCWLNGVYMTSLASLACYRGIQRHRGPHNLGQGEEVDEGVWISYVNSVMKKIDDVKESYKGEKCKKNTINQFINDMNDASKEICENLANFTWSISWDGFGYNPTIKPKIGCANVEVMKDRRNVLKTITPTNLVNWDELSFGDMSKILDLPKGELQKVCCNKKHKIEFRKIKKRIRQYKFKVGH